MAEGYIQVYNSMNGVVLNADKEEKLVRVSQFLANNRADAVIVRDNGTPVGIITRTDIIKALADEENDPNALLAATIMNQPMITISAEENLVEANNIMLREGLTKLPVIKDVDIVGLLLKSDILRDLDV